MTALPNIVRDEIASSIAELVRIVPAPTGKLGWGRDLSCGTDLTERMEEIDQDSPLGVAQATLRRFSTERNTLVDDLSADGSTKLDSDYGEDVVDLVNKGITTDDLSQMPGKLRAEALKDDRIASIDVVVTFDGKSLTIACHGELVDPDKEDFDLTFSVTDGQIAVQEIG
jgi:hypothetical protein